MSEPITEAAERSADPTPSSPDAEETRRTDELVEQELLVEDVSIDGMCGVY